MGPEAFWASGAWPREPVGYTFLARAFNKLGEARFGADWTGTEGTTIGSPPDSLLQESIRQFQSTKPDDPLYEAAWRNTIAARESIQPLISRRDAVQSEIALKCETGELVSAWRHLRGGELVVLPAAVWSTGEVTIWQRFRLCRLYRDDPFKSDFGIIPEDREDLGHIFIQNAGLHRLLSGAPPGLVSASRTQLSRRQAARP